LSVTVQAPADAVVTTAVAVLVAVDVAVGASGVADPPHAATSIPAPIAAAIERARVDIITISCSSRW
jgi:hypothetical protein